MLPAYVIEGALRSFREWTPTRIRCAEIAADAGRISEAALLCEALLGDDRVQTVLPKRWQRLLGLPLTFEAGQGRKKRAAAKAIEAEEDYWSILPEETHAQFFEWGWLLGLAPGQMRWERREQIRRNIPIVEFWHPANLSQDSVTRKWSTKTASDPLGTTPFTPGDGHWLLFTPFGSHRPVSRGKWRGIGRMWLLKQYAILDWARNSEVHTKLFLENSFDIAELLSAKSKIKTIMDNLVDDILTAGRDAVIALPPGFKAVLMERSGSTWEEFKAQIEMVDKAITLAIDGSDLNTDASGGGSFAAAAAQGSPLNNSLRYDANQSSTFEHDQIFVFWTDENFGDPLAAPWPIRQIPEDVNGTIDQLGKLGDAVNKLKTASQRVDADAILEDHGVKLLPPEQAKQDSPPVAPTQNQTTGQAALDETTRKRTPGQSG